MNDYSFTVEVKAPACQDDPSSFIRIVFRNAENEVTDIRECTCELGEIREFIVDVMKSMGV